jgi:transcriptional regulator with XRE-family HTH domain
MSKSFGEILKEAREAKGLSTSQVASRTHILIKTIEALEEENFSKIPAPIYGRGFVRLYCDCVGIDSKPLIEEYMLIHSGAKTPLYKRQKKAPQEESLYTSEESVFTEEPKLPPIVEVPVEEEKSEENPAQNEPMEETASSTSGLELFEQPEKINPFGEVRSKHRVPPTRPELPDEDLSPFLDTPKPSRSLPPRQSVAERFKGSITVFSDEIVKTVHNIPRRTWRMVTLAGAIILILFFIGWMISKLYQVTSGNTTTKEPSKQVQNATNDTDAKEKLPTKPRGKLKSSGLSVPSLYVD